MSLRLNDLKPALGASSSVLGLVAVLVLVWVKQQVAATKGLLLVRVVVRSSLVSKGQTPMQRRLPKIGFRSRSVANTAEVLSYKLDNLEPGEIDFASLRLAKLVPSTAKKAKIVKKGRLTKVFVLKGIESTAGARAMIETTGGSFQE